MTSFLHFAILVTLYEHETSQHVVPRPFVKRISTVLHFVNTLIMYNSFENFGA